METLLLYYFISVNILLFLLMGFDKQLAIHKKRRVREITLFTLGVLGGFVGGFLGMFLFRHKTRKFAFYAVYGLSLCLYGGFAIFAGAFL